MYYANPSDALIRAVFLDIPQIAYGWMLFLLRFIAHSFSHLPGKHGVAHAKIPGLSAGKIQPFRDPAGVSVLE
jgi:hypothetical protein